MVSIKDKRSEIKVRKFKDHLKFKVKGSKTKANPNPMKKFILIVSDSRSFAVYTSTV